MKRYRRAENYESSSRHSPDSHYTASSEVSILIGHGGQLREFVCMRNQHLSLLVITWLSLLETKICKTMIWKNKSENNCYFFQSLVSQFPKTSTGSDCLPSQEDTGTPSFTHVAFASVLLRYAPIDIGHAIIESLAGMYIFPRLRRIRGYTHSPNIL